MMLLMAAKIQKIMEKTLVLQDNERGTYEFFATETAYGITWAHQTGAKILIS
jgi:hypothetical protein